MKAHPKNPSVPNDYATIPTASADQSPTPSSSPRCKEAKAPTRVPLTTEETTTFVNDLEDVWHQLALKHPVSEPETECLATIEETIVYRSEAGHANIELKLRIDGETNSRRLVLVLNPKFLCFAFHALRRLGVNSIENLPTAKLKGKRIRVVVRLGKNRQEAISIIGLARPSPSVLAA